MFRLSNTGHQPRDIGALLDARATELGDQPFVAFIESEQTLSYAEFNQRVDALSVGLRRMGLKSDDRVGLVLPNRLEFMLVWFAATKLGAVHVPVNVYHKGAVLSYVLNDSGAEMLVVDDEYVDRVVAVLPELTSVRTILLVGGDPDACVGARNAAGDSVDFVEFSEVSVPGKRLEQRVEASPWTPEAVVYTSGTTGPSKGALVCHHHRLTMAEDWMSANDFGRGDTLYTPFPFFHPLATTLGVLPALVAGGTVAVSTRFSVSNYWKEARKSRATHAHILFSLATLLLKEPPSAHDRTHNVRRVHPASSTLAEEFEQRFGARITEVWGGGETGIFTYSPAGLPARSGSCGRPNPRYEVIVVDDEDIELEDGQVGEMVVRPKEPWVLPLEYLNKPRQSFESMRNGWFHLGDMGYRDEDGFFYFTDRKKDCVRRRGETVSSYEVENVISGHDSVLEAAVVGVDSGLARGDQDILAYIVLAEGAEFEPLNLIEYCDANMAYFMVPRFLCVRESMPKTPTGKIAKFELRSEGLPRGAWDRDSTDLKLTK